MKQLTLQEDLIKDFQEQKKAVKEHIALVDPMATSLRMPVAQRLFNSGFIVLMEVVSWLFVLGCIALAIFMDKLQPFYLLNLMNNDTANIDKYGKHNLDTLFWVLRGMAIFSAILLIIIARMLARIRLKNSVLHIAGKNMKQLAEQLLSRKVTMESISQRYETELPSNDDTIIVTKPLHHNDELL